MRVTIIGELDGIKLEKEKTITIGKADLIQRANDKFPTALCHVEIPDSHITATLIKAKENVENPLVAFECWVHFNRTEIKYVVISLLWVTHPSEEDLISGLHGSA